MPLIDATYSTALQAIHTAMLNAAKAGTPWTDKQYCDAVAAAQDTQIKTASLSVPGTGLTAPSGGGPVTGTSTTGALS